MLVTDADLPDPGVYREVRPAWSDDNLRNLCRHIRSPLFFAHVRATTGTAVTRPNCHPFVSGRWSFMHNGQIGDWSLIRRKVEELIPDTYYNTRLGTTDSEAVFLAILGAGAWGTALASHAAARHPVVLWSRSLPICIIPFLEAIAMTENPDLTASYENSFPLESRNRTESIPSV